MAIVEYTVSIGGTTHHFWASETESEDSVITETWYDIYSKAAGA